MIKDDDDDDYDDSDNDEFEVNNISNSRFYQDAFALNFLTSEKEYIAATRMTKKRN